MVLSKLIIKQCAYEKLLKLAENPRIISGFLIGKRGSDVVWVDEVRDVKTRTHWTIHFQPVFKHFRQVANEIHKEGKEIIGEFHTHPKGTSWPTQRDKQIMKELSIGLWIISTPKEASVWCFDIWKMDDWVEEHINKLDLEIIS